MRLLVLYDFITNAVIATPMENVTLFQGHFTHWVFPKSVEDPSYYLALFIKLSR